MFCGWVTSGMAAERIIGIRRCCERLTSGLCNAMGATISPGCFAGEMGIADATVGIERAIQVT
jgi:hypothetical protein